MNLPCKCSSSARFLIVLQKSGEPILRFNFRIEVLSHRLRVFLARADVKVIVIRVVKTLLLCRFQIPVELSREQNARYSFVYSCSPAGQNNVARWLRLHSGMSSNTSIALSHHTRLRCPAIRCSSPVIASSHAELVWFSCSVSGYPEK